MVYNGFQICGVISSSSPKKYATHGIEEVAVGYSHIGTRSEAICNVFHSGIGVWNNVTQKRFY